MSEDELADAFVARSPGALEEAYARYGRSLARVAAATLADPTLGWDCVHDTLLRLWLAPASYRRERGTLRAFLLVCVRNAALGRRRDAVRGATIERRAAADRRATEATDSLAELPDPVDVSRLHAALRALPTEQRTVIELAYFRGRSQSEIARELGLPLGTIKGRAALGLRKLTSLLDPVRTTS